jgi:predicted  nucleic acid-binding Zn-ribbon protein
VEEASELTLAKLRDLADLYRQLAVARRDQDHGARREQDLAALDAEYADDAGDLDAAADGRRQESAALEATLREVEQKLQQRRAAPRHDASTTARLADEIATLQRRRDQLEQRLLELWQEQDRADRAGAAGQAEAATAREGIAAERAERAERRRKADLAVPEITGEIELLHRRLPRRVGSRLRQIARRHDDPVADLVQGACGSCGHRLPPQDAVDADREASLITCEGCGRYVVARSSRRTRAWGES